MRVKVGHNFFDAKVGKTTPVSWDTERLINAHMLILGASGVGKTHTIRKLIRRALANPGPKVRFHVFDVHGDIEIPGASEVQFSESVPYGLNPLRVNPDPHFGGVRKCVNNFIRTINTASGSPLGDRQEAVLTNLLLDVYREFDFEVEDPASWGRNGAQVSLVGGQTANRLYLNVPYAEKDEAHALGARWDTVKKLWWCHTENYAGGLTKWPPAHRERHYPTIRDVLEYAERVHLERFLGTDQKAVLALKNLNRIAKSYQIKLRAAAKEAKLHGEFDVHTREMLEEARTEACEAYEHYAKSVQTGHELESLVKYDSTELLKSTFHRLQNLHRTGLFKEAPAPFERTCPVWRYKINALSQEEKKMFVLFTLQDLFYKALQRGETDGQVVEIVCLDELGVYCSAADKNEGDGIIGTICREGRKFGLALWGATQSPAAVHESLLSSTATKMILGLDEMFWPFAISKLRVEQNCLEWIRAQSSLAIQMKEKGSLKNRWWWVTLEDD